VTATFHKHFFKKKKKNKKEKRLIGIFFKTKKEFLTFVFLKNKKKNIKMP
jgi:hypothetical protein